MQTAMKIGVTSERRSWKILNLVFCVASIDLGYILFNDIFI